MAAASQPRLTARAISPIMSPAPGPAMAPPSSRPPARSKISLVMPYSAPLAMARPEADQGKRATSTAMSLAPRLILGQADPGHLGRV
jgi:hypothetical protein